MTIADYNQIVDTWADAIYRYALKYLGGSSSAQDIVQDCFEKLWIHRDPGRSGQSKILVVYNCPPHHDRRNQESAKGAHP